MDPYTAGALITGGAGIVRGIMQARTQKSQYEAEAEMARRKQLIQQIMAGSQGQVNISKGLTANLGTALMGQ